MNGTLRRPCLTLQPHCTQIHGPEALPGRPVEVPIPPALECTIASDQRHFRPRAKAFQDHLTRRPPVHTNRNERGPRRRLCRRSLDQRKERFSLRISGCRRAGCTRATQADHERENRHDTDEPSMHTGAWRNMGSVARDARPLRRKVGWRAEHHDPDLARFITIRNSVAGTSASNHPTRLGAKPGAVTTSS
jgi:hypothetical protein